MDQLNQKTIAIVARNISGKTGTSNTILKQARWLAEKNWQVILIGSVIHREASAHPSIRRITIPDIRIGSFIKRKFFASIAGFFARKNTGTLVHGHGDILTQDILSLHNCVHKAHELIHGSPLPRSSGVGRIHAAQLQRPAFRSLIANSKVMKKDLMQRYAIPDDRITVIYPGHDPSLFNTDNKKQYQQEVLARYSIPTGSFIVGFLSSGDFAKRNLETAIKAFGQIPANERKDMHFIAAGYDRTIPHYKNMARQMGIADTVTFTGGTDRTDHVFKSFDVYIHPAHFEEFGQTVQEALACGVPTITTRMTGAAELIRGDACDLVIENPADAEKIASLILSLKKNPVMRNELSRASAAAVKDNTWDHNFSRVYHVYESVFNRKSLKKSFA